MKRCLPQYNLELVTDIGPPYYQEQHLSPINRTLDVSEIERVEAPTRLGLPNCYLRERSKRICKFSF